MEEEGEDKEGSGRGAVVLDKMEATTTTDVGRRMICFFIVVDCCI